MLRFLMLVISLLSGGAYWVWASQPLWVSGAYQNASYIGYSEPDQSVVALVQEESGAYFEWRELLTGKVVKRVQVELPGVPKLLLAYINSQLGKSEHDVALVLIEEKSRKTYTMPFNLNTGKPIAPVDLSTADMFDPESCGQKCALYNSSFLFLVDGKRKGTRQLEIANINNARFFSDGKHLACTQPNVLLIIEWSSGKVIARAPVQAADSYMMFVSSNNDIYLFHYGAHPEKIMHAQRWTWDGLKLSAATSAVPLPSSEVGLGTWLRDGVIREGRGGRVHATCYVSKTWPASVRPVLDWLNKQGIKVDKYYPRRTLLLGAVLDRNCSIVGKFDYDVMNNQYHFDQYQLYIRHSEAQNSIALYGANAVWPNALAVAVMVYLLGYVYRYRKVRVTQGEVMNV